MRAFALVAVWMAALSSFANNATNALAQFSPKFGPDTKIVWATPTNQLPQTLWTYKRLPTRPFSISAISNAFALASLKDKKIPEPSTNSYFIWSPPGPCGTSFDIFSIQPASGTISFGATNQNLFTNDVPSPDAVLKRAFGCARQLGLNEAELIPKNVYGSSNATGCEPLTTGICARGIFLSRKLDGLCFYGDANNGSDGFSIEFGSHAQIRSFSLIWPHLERFRQHPCVTSDEIMRSIREQKIEVVPGNDESNYFERIETLAHAKTFTITKITPLYIEGIFGQTPANDLPVQFITPMAELEAVADFGTNKTTARLLCPIIEPESDKPIQKGTQK